MDKILLIGKTDSTYTQLGDRLAAHYTVRYGSSGGFAAEALLSSFAPSLIVIRAAGSEKDIIRHIAEKHSSVPVVLLGTPEEAAGLTEFHPAAVCPDDVQAAYDAVCAALPHSGGAAEKLTVMVIDDDAGILRMMKSMIGGEFDMVLATSGSKALALLDRKRPDVILLDYEMPEMNGLETLAAIRGKADHAGIPVIFLTGANTPDVVGSIQAANTAGYLMKPADAPDIIAAVRKAASPLLKRDFERF